MKPVSLCLVQMGNKGLEMVKAYPNVLPQNIINEIIIKSMPLGAKDGDFTSSVINDNSISGYVFSIPSKNERDNIASIVAVYDTTEYNSNEVRKLFAILISELRNKNAVSIDILMQVLPLLYNSFGSKNVKIKISSVVNIEFTISNETDDEKTSKKDIAKAFADDMWK